MAIEYVFVVAFAFVLLAPLIYVFYTESATLEDEVAAAQAKKVMDELVGAIDTVYYLGPPSRQTLSLYFPKRLTGITIQEDIITFTLESAAGGPYELAGYASTNITGSIGVYSGVHSLTLVAAEDSVVITEN